MVVLFEGNDDAAAERGERVGTKVGVGGGIPVRGAARVLLAMRFFIASSRARRSAMASAPSFEDVGGVPPARCFLIGGGCCAGENGGAEEGFMLSENTSTGSRRES